MNKIPQFKKPKKGKKKTVYTKIKKIIAIHCIQNLHMYMPNVSLQPGYVIELDGLIKSYEII